MPTPTTLHPALTPAVIQAMREWALECEWLDADAIADYTDRQIVRGIERHYEGGVDAFLLTMD